MSRCLQLTSLLWLLLLVPAHISATETRSNDVVVYGGTSSGIAAAVQAARMGNTVAVVCPDKLLGTYPVAASAGPTPGISSSSAASLASFIFGSGVTTKNRPPRVRFALVGNQGEDPKGPSL